MKIRTVLFSLVMMLVLSGCVENPNSWDNTQPSVPTSEISCSTSAALPEITEQIMELTTEPSTAPAFIFPLDSGACLETYTDDETLDYLDYYLFIPENANADMPMIIFLHGDGEVGNPEKLADYGLIRAVRDIYGENFPFIVVSPCTRTASWTSGSIPQTLMGLIEHLSERLSVDKDRIILSGHSRGAMGVWNLISTYGDYFAAAVPVSCGAETTLNMENCIKVPVRAYVGNLGEYENMYRTRMFNIVQKMVEYGGTAELIVLENRNHGQTAHDAFTQDTFTWMLSQ